MLGAEWWGTVSKLKWGEILGWDALILTPPPPAKIPAITPPAEPTMGNGAAHRAGGGSLKLW